MWETIDLDDYDKVIDFLQKQSNRIKDLEEREEQLLSEIEDFQELLAKNDDVCHKRVINLIDEKIDKLQGKYDFGQQNNFCPMHNIMHSINVLKELKKELIE